MVAFYDWLFDEALYKQDAATFRLDAETARRATGALERLQRAWGAKRFKRAGRDIAITETKALQAFNHVVFQEMLGYDDLMSDGAMYALLPEVSFSASIAGGGNVTLRTDLAIGQFAWSGATVAAVTELKSPGADLTAKQKGASYYSEVSRQQVSAAEQATEAMTAASCQWALVSNMQRVCLICARRLIAIGQNAASRSHKTPRPDHRLRRIAITSPAG